jgi:hypothetical protein
MTSVWKRALLRIMSWLLPKRLADAILRRLIGRLRRYIADVEGALTNEFLQLLLGGMEVAFCISGSYRRNIKGFSGKFAFKTTDGKVGMSAVFEAGRMRVERKAIAPANVTVIFTNAAAIWRFLFSPGQDILQSILANEVEVDGNLNYVYKLGYMASDLKTRLGVD